MGLFSDYTGNQDGCRSALGKSMQDKDAKEIAPNAVQYDPAVRVRLLQGRVTFEKVF